MKKVYEAQALAVVMIVLVIAAILGVAMFSRTMKDSQRVTAEKSSAEAVEFADSILESVRGTTVDKLVTTCSNAQYGSGLKSAEGCKASGSTEVNQFLSSLGISTDVAKFDKCTNEGSDVSLYAGLATSEDELELRSDSVRSFVLSGQVPNPAACTLDLTFEPRGEKFGGITVSKIYAKNYVNGVPSTYKEYEYSDSLAYCIYSKGENCFSNSDMFGTWTPVQAGDKLSISLAAVNGYQIDEIRVRSVGGVVAMKSSLSNPNCVKDWEMIKVVVAANCSGAYRAKEVQFPQKDWAMPLFDYVLFNGKGALEHF